MARATEKVVVRFAMTKGDGDFPLPEEFSSEEQTNPLLFTRFFLVWDPETAENEGLVDVEITECIVVYDGVSRFESNDWGLYFEGGELQGYPSPIIQFKVSKKVEPESFMRCIWSSGLTVCPTSRDERDLEPFVFEDQNGYTSVVKDGKVKDLVSLLKSSGNFSGKIFTFQEMEEGVDCMEMSPNKV